MDSYSAAAAATARSLAAKSVPAALCRDCKARVAWVTSKRTGKPYLADALPGTPGKVIPMPHRPHFKTCTKEGGY